MNFRIHLEKSWRLMIDNLLTLIFMTLAMLVVSMLTLGLLAPALSAGYMDSILSLVRRGREPAVQDIFSQMKLALPLLLFFAVVFLICMIGYMIFFPLGVLAACAITYGCIYVLPLMCDKQLGLREALVRSWDMATKQDVTDHLVLVVLFMGISAIGSFIFIGTLFTMPFATILLASVYLEKIT